MNYIELGKEFLQRNGHPVTNGKEEEQQQQVNQQQ
jgi:hypothetical protein